MAAVFLFSVWPFRSLRRAHAEQRLAATSGVQCAFHKFCAWAAAHVALKQITDAIVGENSPAINLAITAYCPSLQSGGRGLALPLADYNRARRVGGFRSQRQGLPRHQFRGPQCRVSPLLQERG